jgi:hypothetical protein
MSEKNPKLLAGKPAKKNTKTHMKQIINHKRYDTKTATEIAAYSNGRSPTDFGHVHETLYRTTKGAYFLCGQGGANSKYAESSYGCTSEGSRLVPLTPDEASAWLEEGGKTAELEREFPEQIQDA